MLETRPALAALGAELELIVVDDGSRDRIAQIAADYPEVRLVRHRTRHGYGAALKTGFARAQGCWLGLLDVDGTYPPEYLAILLDAAHEYEADLVIGLHAAGSDRQNAFSRRGDKPAFATQVSLISSYHFSRGANGMCTIRREALARLYPLPDGQSFATVVSTRAIHKELDMVEVPIPCAEPVCRSRLAIVEDAARHLQSMVWTALGHNPMRVLIGIGVVCLAAAVFIGVILTGERLQGITELDKWDILGLFSALVPSVAGVSSFTLGVTFNYLAAPGHKELVRKDLLGKPVFDPPLDRQFGWIGLLMARGGLVIVGISLGFGFAFQGWPVSRLWPYLLVSVIPILVGMQLMIWWLVPRVLGGLCQRESLKRRDPTSALPSTPSPINWS